MKKSNLKLLEDVYKLQEETKEKNLFMLYKRSLREDGDELFYQPFGVSVLIDKTFTVSTEPNYYLKFMDLNTGEQVETKVIDLELNKESDVYLVQTETGPILLDVLLSASLFELSQQEYKDPTLDFLENTYICLFNGACLNLVNFSTHLKKFNPKEVNSIRFKNEEGIFMETTLKTQDDKTMTSLDKLFSVVSLNDFLKGFKSIKQSEKKKTSKSKNKIKE